MREERAQRRGASSSYEHEAASSRTHIISTRTCEGRMVDGEGCKKAAFAPPPKLTEGDACTVRVKMKVRSRVKVNKGEERNDGECDVGMYEYEHVRMQERGLNRMHFRRSERGVEGGGSSSW